MKPLVAIAVLLCWAGSLDAAYRWTSRGWVNSNCNCEMCQSYWGSYGQRTTTTTVKAATKTVAVPTALAGTPRAGVEGFLSAFPLTQDDLLVDLGCGDARILIAAHKRYGCRCIGIEQDRRLAQIALNRIRAAGLTTRQVAIVIGNVNTHQALWWRADVIYCYQYPEVLKEFLAVLPPHATCIAYMHRWPGQRQRRVSKHFYVLETE
jgi:hypothetical protein